MPLIMPVISMVPSLKNTCADNTRRQAGDTVVFLYGLHNGAAVVQFLPAVACFNGVDKMIVVSVLRGLGNGLVCGRVLFRYTAAHAACGSGSGRRAYLFNPVIKLNSVMNMVMLNVTPMAATSVCRHRASNSDCAILVISFTFMAWALQ